MKNVRTKVIIGLVAIFTAGSLFAMKAKMMHHRKARMGDCQKMESRGDMKLQDHHSHYKFDCKK